MPTIAYIKKRIGADAKEIIEQANVILDEYRAQGFRLTLRQLYYQFVSRDIITNTMKSYKRLGNIINDGRLLGLIDWNDIEDRTRSVHSPQVWQSPSHIIDVCARAYQIDLWEDQEFRPEVWIEKEALAGIIEGVCAELRISYLSCRGYTSQSEMWGSSQRIQRIKDAGQTPLILHFGDHDPSGIDMTRDIINRMELFIGGIEVKRMALNMEQVEKYNPPPNPAKITDSRFASYEDRFGSESWELDALEPKLIGELITSMVLTYREEDKWAAAVEREQKDIQTLRKFAKTVR